jgi:hypothetical protein
MKKCNSDFVCEEDLITMEPIGDNEPCVAVEDNMCTTCETINTSKNSNPILFNENPLKAIFNKNASLEENEKFWAALRDNCGIERSETSAQAAPAFYVAEPDYEELDRFQDIIQRRIQQYLGEGKINNNNASKFITTMYKVARAPVGENFTTKADPSEFLRIKIKNILEDDACSSQITHKTLELPLTVYTYFSDLSDAEESKFIGVVKFLDQASQLCIDGTFERFDKILHDTSGGKNKRTKGKRTKGKRTKGKRTKGKRTKGKRTKGKRTKGRRKTKGRR